MALTKLPGSRWWIETDDASPDTIIGEYYRPQVVADIASIEQTLLLYPSATQDATDVEAIIGRVTASTWTEERKARVLALIQAMYQAYMGDPRCLEAAQLQAKLDALKILLARLV